MQRHHIGSAQAFASPNVQRELNLAVEENKPILPLLLEAVTYPAAVAYILAGRQWGLFVVKVPGDFGSNKVTWTLTVNGKTSTIPASLHPDLSPSIHDGATSLGSPASPHAPTWLCSSREQESLAQ